MGIIDKLCEIFNINKKIIDSDHIKEQLDIFYELNLKPLTLDITECSSSNSNQRQI